MCAIVGAVVAPGATFIARAIIDHIYNASHTRGRDGRGYTAQFDKEILPDDEGQYTYKDITRDSYGVAPQWPSSDAEIRSFIGNLRAEPTTEYVRNKRRDDQQPYRSGAWSVVHNGTIANDKDLRDYSVNTTIDSAAIAEVLQTEYNRVPNRSAEGIFETAVRKLKGSFALLATCRGSQAIHFACNYRPIWIMRVENVGIFFASSRDFFPTEFGTPEMIPPYSIGHAWIRPRKEVALNYYPLKLTSPNYKKALVVCSGGLDSVVAATFAKRRLGYDVTLLHFNYGCRAGENENKAIVQVANELGVSILYQDIGVYRTEDSPLLQKDSKIAGGEAGAEFAYEWVPARNLLMLSMATAIAEARGFEVLVLGNNLEEAGAYPDNEPEFIARFNDLLPFAIGDGKRMRVEMPVGNLMKHEIVALGHSIGAPMQHTWSCYRAGALHCGKCGPCFMRRTAFEINELEDPIHYASEK